MKFKVRQTQVTQVVYTWEIEADSKEEAQRLAEMGVPFRAIRKEKILPSLQVKSKI